jgi:hypothetical protein
MQSDALTSLMKLQATTALFVNSPSPLEKSTNGTSRSPLVLAYKEETGPMQQIRPGGFGQNPEGSLQSSRREPGEWRNVRGRKYNNR